MMQQVYQLNTFLFYFLCLLFRNSIIFLNMKINSIVFILYLFLFVVTFSFLFSNAPIVGGDYVPISKETIKLFMSPFGWCSYLTMGSNCIPITLHYAPLGIVIYALSLLTGSNYLLVEKLIWWLPF